MSAPARVGIVGLGKIVGAYLSTLPRLPNLALTAGRRPGPGQGGGRRGRAPGRCAAPPGRALCLRRRRRGAEPDDPGSARARSRWRRSAPASTSTGRSRWPLRVAEAREVLAAAEQAGVAVGCAPDTVLGTGVQTARVALDSGLIGAPDRRDRVHDHARARVVASRPRVLLPPRRWPAAGHGPVLPERARHPAGSGQARRRPQRAAAGTRTIGSGPRAGTQFDVEVPTHISGVLEHESGALSTMLMSFDVWAAQLPRIEVYGDTGSLSVPDPNGFDGLVRVYEGAGPRGGAAWLDRRRGPRWLHRRRRAASA